VPILATNGQSIAPSQYTKQEQEISEQRSISAIREQMSQIKKTQ